MSFLRHGEIFRSDGAVEPRGRTAASRRSAPGPGKGAREERVLAHRLDESPVGYPSAGCSPAEPTCVSPTIRYSAISSTGWSIENHRPANHCLTGCLSPGVHFTKGGLADC